MALARWYQAELTLLHVRPAFVPAVGEFPYLPNPGLLDPQERERLSRDLEREAAAARAAGVVVQTVLRDGRPAEEIVAAATAMAAGLVVMGTHGRGGFERWVLGSVAEKVLRQAPCPVMTIPPASAERPPRELFRTIVCATDFSEASTLAVRFALSLAQEAAGRLVLLHVLEALPVLEVQGGLSFDVGDYRAHLEREARELMRRAVPESARDWCAPEEIVAAGKAWREILRLAGEKQAELIVLGVHGRGALDRMVFGSTTHHVVREAGCPVLSVRERRAAPAKEA
jgi:nucleotide-binding universal stress UspA family protein